MENFNKISLNFNRASINDLSFLNKDFFYTYSLLKFDVVLINYYLILWFWENNKFLKKFRDDIFNINFLENSFFISFNYVDAINFYNFFEKFIYINFFNFFFNLKLNFNELYFDIYYLNNFNYLNKKLILNLINFIKVNFWIKSRS